MCLLSASHSLFGERHLSASILKRIRLERLRRDNCADTSTVTGDLGLTVRDLIQGLHQRRSPFQLVRVRRSFEQLVYALERGIFLCLFSFRHPDTQIMDKHYLVIDCERQIILDSSESEPISFLNLTPEQTRKRISCSMLERVWQVRVHLKRIGETCHI